MVSQKSLRILFLSTSFPSSGEDPSGFFVYQLALALHKQGVDLSVLTPQKGDCKAIWPLPFAVKYFNYAPSRFQVLAQYPGGIPAALQANKMLYGLIPVFVGCFAFHLLRMAGSADLIVANWSITGLLAGILKRLHKKPIVTVLRGSDVIIKRKRTLPFILKKAIDCSQAVVCVGSDHAESLNQKLRSNKIIQCIPNGIHPAFFNVKELKPSYPLLMTFVGSLIHRKRIDTIIHALKRLEDLSIHLKIVGDGPQSDDLATLATRIGVDERISFFCTVPPGKSMARVLSQTHILILASEHEGRPNVVIEAMASGRAIVGTDISGISELVLKAKAGKVFDVGDTKALESCIREYYIDRKQLEQSGKNARKWVEQQDLRWENTARKYMLLFHSL
ncbi:MAG: glycosyltransferase family 4 protein [Bacteroidetes bacterium]|nr:glycosyltransferase family 4 protein [Bacteroidota bacterium]